jgi:hypothetical protein
MIRRSAAVLLAVTSLCACGAQRLGGVPNPEPAGTAAPLKSTNVSITIPSARQASSFSRRAAYVSSATNSMVISPQGQSSIIVPLTASSPGCSSAAGGRQCNVAISLPVGTYAIGIALYGSSDGTGSPLALTSSVQTIAANALNKLAFTLNAVLSRISVALAPDNVFSLGIPGTRTVGVTAMDSSNATIVVGMDTLVDQTASPVSVRLSVTDTTGALSISPTVAGTTPSTLLYNGAASGGAAVVASASNANNAMVASKQQSITIGTGSLPLAPTVSRYVQNMNLSTFVLEGQTMGGQGQSGLVILDFGTPWHCDSQALKDGYCTQGGTFGTFINAGLGDYATTADILAASEAFVDGWYGAHSADFSQQLRLVVGTNNYCAPRNDDCARIWFYDHGNAWGAMLQSLVQYVRSRGYGGQVSVAGGSGMETDYNTPALTAQWVNGFNAASTATSRLALYDYGDAAGCPSVYSGPVTNAPCDNGWRQSDVLYIAWEHAIPIPQIYCDTVNARQWHMLSLYSVSAGFGKIEFPGVLTEHSAAAQRNSTCNGVTVNSPRTALQNLQSELSKDTLTQVSGLVYATDLTYSTGNPTPLTHRRTEP